MTKIDSVYFANYFTNKLNIYGSSSGQYFKIFADEGNLKKAINKNNFIRKGNLANYNDLPTTGNIVGDVYKITEQTTDDYPLGTDYIWDGTTWIPFLNNMNFTSGIAKITESQLIPIRDIKLTNYTVEVTLFVDKAIGGMGEDDISYNLNDIRDVIVDMINDINGTTSIVNIGDISFNQSVILQYPISGTNTEVGFINDCYTLYLTANFSLFQDGVNSNDCSIILNGVELPFTKAVMTRVRVGDSNTYNGEISTKTTMQSQGLSVDLVVPAMNNNELSRLIMDDLLKGGYYALSVYISTPLSEYGFIGTLGNNSITLDIATNIAFNISIVEGNAGELDFGYSNKWQKITSTSDTESINVNNYAIIYWGDGTVEYKTEEGTYQHTYTDGASTHLIRVYGG